MDHQRSNASRRVGGVTNSVCKDQQLEHVRHHSLHIHRHKMILRILTRNLQSMRLSHTTTIKLQLPLPLARPSPRVGCNPSSQRSYVTKTTADEKIEELQELYDTFPFPLSTDPLCFESYTEKIQKATQPRKTNSRLPQRRLRRKQSMPQTIERPRMKS